MIDLKELKARRDEIAQNIRVRNMSVDIDAIIELQEKRSALMQEAENLRAQRNENAQKMKGKLDAQARTALIAEGKSLKESIASVEEELNAIDKAFSEQAGTIPNYAHPDAPVGKEDKDNTAIKFVGGIPVGSPSRPRTMCSLGNRWISSISIPQPGFRVQSFITSSEKR